MQYDSWLNRTIASSMPGENNCCWSTNEPAGYIEGDEICTCIAPTHFAGLMSNVCSQNKNVFYELSLVKQYTQKYENSIQLKMFFMN